MLIRREEGDEREEGDVDQKHQIFSPPSSSRIALARADAPIPKCPGTSAIEISISGFKRKVNISIDGFEQRPLFPHFFSYACNPKPPRKAVHRYPAGISLFRFSRGSGFPNGLPLSPRAHRENYRMRCRQQQTSHRPIPRDRQAESPQPFSPGRILNSP